MHGFVYTQIVGAFPMDIGHLSHGQLTMFNYLKLYWRDSNANTDNKGMQVPWDTNEHIQHDTSAWYR